MRKGRKLQRTLLSLIMVMAMVFTMVTIPGEVVKADPQQESQQGSQRVEFYNATLYETNGSGTTSLTFTVDGKSVKVQMGTFDNEVFTPVVFTDDMKNTNDRYEVECQSEIQYYYLKVVNDENADYKLVVDRKDEPIGENGFFQFHSADPGAVVSVELQSNNDGNPGSARKLTVKLKDVTVTDNNINEITLCENNDVMMEDTSQYGIKFIETRDSNGVITRVDMELTGGENNNANFVLVIDGSPRIDVKGFNEFRGIELKPDSGFEMWGHMSFKEGEGYDHLIGEDDHIENRYATIKLGYGIINMQDQKADCVSFRDSLIVRIENNGENPAFQNIRTVRFANFDFHDRKTFNAHINVTNPFCNVDKVEIVSAKVALECENMGAASPQEQSHSTNVEIFAEGLLRFLCKEGIGDVSLTSKYHNSYPHDPEGEGNYVEKMDNAGEIGGEYISCGNVNLDKEGENVVDKYILNFDAETPEGKIWYVLKSTDPILYSVSYHPEENNGIEYETEKGMVTMSGYEKGYYTKDGRGYFEAWIAAGETVTVKILPEQGYQYVKDTLNINGVSINTIAGDDDKEVGTYTFEMPANAGHMCAGFVKTEDVVELSDDSGVASAGFSAGGNIENGNALLTVEKAEPTQEDIAKIKEAENASGVTYQYLDLALSEYVVKNYDKAAAKQEAWTTKLSELDEKASISLVVKNASADSKYDVVRLHDGKAEKLAAQYDSTTKTVTFDTDKFSTYALVYTPVDSGNKPTGGGSSGGGSSGGGSSGGGSTGGGGSSGGTGTTDKTAVSSNKAVSGNTTPDEDKLISTGTITDSKTKAAYTMNSDNTLTFEGPASKNVKKYIIPSSVVIDGKKYKVTKVSEKAFQKCKKLEKVVLPGSIVKIGEKSFAGCKGLEKVVVKKNVETIDKGAFKGCKNLKSLEIKSKKITSIGKNALKGAPKDATIKVPKGNKSEYEKMLRDAGFMGRVK
ncbi:MAG: leucine-rich repeat domain-containing protein [Lachnospiraceae bacterium]|nr:leucine-rich repeat domain-containing protein [Lachnospiraceae bacterium]